MANNITSRHPRLLVVGAGQRTIEVLLPALSRAALPLQVTAICDPDPTATSRITELSAAGHLGDNIPVFEELDQALAAGPYEVAILACPHDLHQELTRCCNSGQSQCWPMSTPTASSIWRVPRSWSLAAPRRSWSRTCGAAHRTSSGCEPGRLRPEGVAVDPAFDAAVDSALHAAGLKVHDEAVSRWREAIEAGGAGPAPLPGSLQLVAPHGGEEHLLAFAKAIESAVA